MGFLKKVKKVLTVLTDILLIGRAKDWWNQKPGPNTNPPKENPK